MDKNLNSILKALSSIPVFFILAWVTEKFLSKYTVVGPVGPESGLPLVDSYPQAVFYGLVAVAVVGFAYSFMKVWSVQGWPRYATLALAILLLPIQFLYIVGINISLFGK